MIDLSFETHTERLVVRPYRETDYSMWRDTHATLPKSKNRWDHGPKPENELTKTAFLALLKEQEQEMSADWFYRLNAFEKDGGLLIGQFSLMDISRAVFQNAYLGYGVFSPFWRLVYGKEAALATLEFAFSTLKLHRVEAGIEPNNKRSIALAKSLNMRREGLSRRRLYVRSQWVDIRIFAMTVEDWKLGSKSRQETESSR